MEHVSSSNKLSLGKREPEKKQNQIPKKEKSVNAVVTCNDNGKIVKSGERYTTPAGDVLLCKYCVLQKIGTVPSQSLK